MESDDKNNIFLCSSSVMQSDCAFSFFVLGVTILFSGYSTTRKHLVVPEGCAPTFWSL